MGNLPGGGFQPLNGTSFQQQGGGQATSVPAGNGAVHSSPLGQPNFAAGNHKQAQPTTQIHATAQEFGFGSDTSSSLI
jgi:hypothetical protein